MSSIANLDAVPSVRGRGPEDSTENRVKTARIAQPSWQQKPLRARLDVIRELRLGIAEEAEKVARTASGRHRDGAAALAAEVLPLLSALRFLETDARSVLASRRLSRGGRPSWLGGLAARVERAPRGVVLVVGPGNYPLLLMAVQIAQALVAGNTVLLKPAPAGVAAAEDFHHRLIEAGLPKAAFLLLDPDPKSVRQALSAGVGHVVFTGSTGAGHAVHRLCAEFGVSSTAEWSGCDAVVLTQGIGTEQELRQAARSVAFGLTLNGGHSCIAPRRILGTAAVLDRFLPLLQEELESRATDLPEADREALAEVVDAAERASALRLFQGSRLGSQVLGFDCSGIETLRDWPSLGASDAPAGMILGVFAVDGDEEAVRRVNQHPFRLGASVFGPRARALAERLDVGFVSVDDVIIGSADPRLPFGGRSASGFGVTRGAEGLLDMTVPKAVSIRRGGALRHLELPREGDAAILSALARLEHPRSLLDRVRAIGQMIRAVRRRGPVKTPPTEENAV